jgi:hypothetical protein
MGPMIKTPPTPGPKAEPKAGGFKRPDLSKVVPPKQQDAVARLVAAGMRIMYSPEMREQVMEVVQGDMPVPQKIAESVVGLMLLINQKAKGQVPIEAIFPAMLELMAEAAEMLAAAKQPVSQADYNEAAQYAAVLMAQKMGAPNKEAVLQGLAAGMPDDAPAPPTQGDA